VLPITAPVNTRPKERSGLDGVSPYRAEIGFPISIRADSL
jgi:hypothetical protein